MGPTHPWWSFGGAYVARRRLVGKEKDIKQSLPFLVKRRKRQLRSIFPNGIILAPHSKIQIWSCDASLRAFLEAQERGEKGGSLGGCT